MNTNKNKSKLDRKAKETARKATGNKSAGGRSREPAIKLGTVAWDNLFQEEPIELPGTVIIERLEEKLNKEQVEKLAEDIKKAIEKRNEECCKADYMSLQDARTQLMALVSEIMMDEAGFIIDQLLTGCRK